MPRIRRRCSRSPSGTPPRVWGGSKVCRPSTQRASKQRSRTQRAERGVAHSFPAHHLSWQPPVPLRLRVLGLLRRRSSHSAYDLRTDPRQKCDIYATSPSNRLLPTSASAAARSRTASALLPAPPQVGLFGPGLGQDRSLGSTLGRIEAGLVGAPEARPLSAYDLHTLSSFALGGCLRP